MTLCIHISGGVAHVNRLHSSLIFSLLWTKFANSYKITESPWAYWSWASTKTNKQNHIFKNWKSEKKETKNLLRKMQQSYQLYIQSRHTHLHRSLCNLQPTIPNALPLTAKTFKLIYRHDDKTAQRKQQTLIPHSFFFVYITTESASTVLYTFHSIKFYRLVFLCHFLFTYVIAGTMMLYFLTC